MKIFISVTYINDIGGISTSIENLLNEIHHMYEVTLYVSGYYISENCKIPPDIRILRGSTYLRDSILGLKILKELGSIEIMQWFIRRAWNRFVIGKERGIEKAIRRMGILGDYDVAIAFSDLAFSAKERKCFDYFVVLDHVKAKRKIAWIHNNPMKLGWTHQQCLQYLSGFDAIVNVSMDCKRMFDSIIPEYESKSKVVYNMYNIDKIIRNSNIKEKLYTNNGNLHIVTVARMVVEQKRIDRIIEVCKRLLKEGISNFDWTLVGTGKDMPMLVNEVLSNGLKDNINFVGLQPNPYPFMRQADVFILSSEYEGLSMTIMEAQILGVPTFVTAFGAATEVIIDGQNGGICNNSTDGLYEMVKDIIRNPERLTHCKKYILTNPVDNKLAIKQFHNLCNS